MAANAAASHKTVRSKAVGLHLLVLPLLVLVLLPILMIFLRTFLLSRLVLLLLLLRLLLVRRLLRLLLLLLLLRSLLLLLPSHPSGLGEVGVSVFGGGYLQADGATPYHRGSKTFNHVLPCTRRNNNSSTSRYLEGQGGCVNRLMTPRSLSPLLTTTRVLVPGSIQKLHQGRSSWRLAPSQSARSGRQDPSNEAL